MQDILVILHIDIWFFPLVVERQSDKSSSSGHQAWTGVACEQVVGSYLSTAAKRASNTNFGKVLERKREIGNGMYILWTNVLYWLLHCVCVETCQACRLHARYFKHCIVTSTFFLLLWRGRKVPSLLHLAIRHRQKQLCRSYWILFLNCCQQSV